MSPKSCSRSIRARSLALRSIPPDVDLEYSSSDEDEVSLAQREFPEVSLQLLNPSEWRLVAYGGFLRDDNIQFLKHVLCGMLSGLKRVNIRRNVF